MMGDAERSCPVTWRSHVTAVRYPTAGQSYPAAVRRYPTAGPRNRTVGRRYRTAGRWRAGTHDDYERGSGTVLAAGLALVVMTAMAAMLLLAQSAVLASRAAAAADLAALAAADALRGITTGEPCSVAADVAARHAATVLSCSEGAGQTIEVRTELGERPLLGAATGHARAGPPP
jgi:secretion/DNA translocation related TadE-like protein